MLPNFMFCYVFVLWYTHYPSLSVFPHIYKHNQLHSNTPYTQWKWGRLIKETQRKRGKWEMYTTHLSFFIFPVHHYITVLFHCSILHVHCTSTVFHICYSTQWPYTMTMYYNYITHYTTQCLNDHTINKHYTLWVNTSEMSDNKQTFIYTPWTLHRSLICLSSTLWPHTMFHTVFLCTYTVWFICVLLYTTQHIHTICMCHNTLWLPCHPIHCFVYTVTTIHYEVSHL
jgi:hypothetical protein